MATEEERVKAYAEYLVANQQQKDTEEYQKVAEAYKQLRASSQQQQPQDNPPSQEETSTGFLGAAQAGGRAALAPLSSLLETGEIAADSLDYLSRIASAGGDVREAVRSYGGRNPFEEQSVIGQASDVVAGISEGGPQFQPTHTFDDVVANPGKLPRFIGEGLLQAVPQGASALNPALRAQMAVDAGNRVLDERQARKGELDKGDLLAAGVNTATQVALSTIGLNAGLTTGLKPTVGQIVRSSLVEAGTEGAGAAVEEIAIAGREVDIARLRNSVGSATILGGVSGAGRGVDQARQSLAQNQRVGAPDLDRLQAKRQAAQIVQHKVDVDFDGEAIPDRKKYIAASKNALEEQKLLASDTVKVLTSATATAFGKGSKEASQVKSTLELASRLSSQQKPAYDQSIQNKVRSLPIDPEVRASLNQQFRVIDELSRAANARESNRRGTVALLSQGAGSAAGFAAASAASPVVGPVAAFGLVAPAAYRAVQSVGSSVLPGVLRDSASARPNIIDDLPDLNAIASRPGGFLTDNPVGPPPPIRTLDPQDIRAKARAKTTERANANRIERIKQDPTGANLRANVLETDRTVAFDARVASAVNRASLQELKGLGLTPEDIGINTGPGSFDGKTDGYFSALTEAFEQGLITKEDVRLFRQDPRALMQDNRGNEVVITALQNVYRSRVRQRLEELTRPEE